MRRAGRIGVMVGLLAAAGLGFGGASAYAQRKSETIQATAWGQQRLAGKIFNLTIIIDSYSTADDQKMLLDAFQKGGQVQLVRVLEKMKSKGRVALTGTLGATIAYVRSFPTETGRRVRILTQRPIRFAEAFHGGRSTEYDVTAIELNLDRTDSSKSTGGLIIAAEIRVDKRTGQMVIESYGSGPWRLANFKEWK